MGLNEAITTENMMQPTHVYRNIFYKEGSMSK